MLWQRLDIPGHEWCELSPRTDGWRLAGIALVAYERRPCRLEYDIACDTAWVTRRAHVWGRIAGESVDLVVDRARDGTWSANGAGLPTLDGCLDIDLAFSPATNLLALRRLALEVGQEAAVRAAWVRFPELALDVLEQSYARLGPATYRYESAQGTFVRELTVDADGFVLDYPALWRAAAVTSHGDAVT